MKRKAFSLITLLLILSMMMLTACGGNTAANNNAAANNDGAAEITGDLVFASGGTSGTYYPYAAAVATAWMNAYEGLNVSVQATGASAENINLISTDAAEIAIVQNDTMTYAYEGTESFSEKGANTDFSTIGTVYAEVVQIVARADAGITSVADLNGRAVSVGDLGSGVEANAKQVLDAYGLTFEDLKAQHLGFGDSVDAMKDGQLDAAFITAGVPTTAVMDYASNNDMIIVPIDGAEAENLFATYSYYTPYTITADTYAGLSEDVTTIAVKATLIANNNLSEDLVYALTKTLFDSQADIAAAHQKGAELDINTATQGVSVPFHPGAEKYYKEMGVLE